MINFRCACGQVLFFENTRCLNCDRQVGFDPERLEMYALPERVLEDGSVEPITLCRNSADFDVCNWLVTRPNSEYCISCQLNHTIPNLLRPKRRRWWKSLEQAKRRLIYSLLRLKLPIEGREVQKYGLAFQFIEDKRTNPHVFEEYVNTGHANGLITINIAEADRVKREMTREYTGELYRTLLGHFRHESGHYYFTRLVVDGNALTGFRELFGNEQLDYGQALEFYYANKNTLVRNPDLISHYAQAHPLEDWAEVWANYLHMVDTLETAGTYDLEQGAAYCDDIDEMLVKWSQLTLLLNALNRSMGLEDAYPFLLSELTKAKLRFVHGLIYPSS